MLVTTAGSKCWRFKYRFAGKQKGLALGLYPDVGLKEARATRDELRGLLADGLDPNECRKAGRQADQEAQARKIDAMRFSLDNEGALSIKLGRRRIELTPGETAGLRVLLHATRDVAVREDLCR